MATPHPSKAELKVNGAFYGGWKTLRCGRSIEQLSGTFGLGITERWPGHPDASPIRPGYACQLLLDGDPVVTGYTDDAEPDYDDQSHNIQVSGRDKTGDLVDCSAIYKSGQWKGARLEQIARDLLKPFGIGLKVEAPTGAPFGSFNIQEGESVHECLDRAARMRAVLLMADGLGNLVLTRAGTRRVHTVLEEGRNIKGARGQFSWKDRFSQYTVKGQGRLGPDGEALDEHVSPSGAATDPAITRYRPLVVLAEDHGETASAGARAAWERNVRRGRGNRATIRVQGWRDDDGELWTPNTRVWVRSPWLWLDAEMLIVGCEYSLSEQGTYTELSIALPEAFELLAADEKPGKADKKEAWR